MPATIKNHAGIRRFVRGYTRPPEDTWGLGLDLGQRHDHSAFAALEVGWTNLGRCPTDYSQLYQPHLILRQLHRFPLLTSYTAVHENVIHRISALPCPDGRSQLAIDAGGPGPAMVERIRGAVPKGCHVRPVIVTGGKGKNTLAGGYTGIPRASLISRLILTMSTGAFIAYDNLPNWDLFEEELVSLSGTNSHPQGTEAHDDLVVAVALAVDLIVATVPELAVISGSLDASSDDDSLPPFGFIDKPLF